ncbi:UNVERIFIED_ORG: hypothetical protein ABIC62_006322 [Burkholderia sp. 1595]|uniref:Uncharacterized protein n=1 Tax=Paraburkholderia terricola TaxID=169427 RepID=A0ABU1M1G7_9BURK|nr:hypothetical protein [Paraburkholderia terricola]MDR6484785.1 hypothetical protein [Paraburkholderia terricola]
MGHERAYCGSRTACGNRPDHPNLRPFAANGLCTGPGLPDRVPVFFQDPDLRFENHVFHEIAIAAATFEGLFVTYVTWRCYRSSGEPLLRWLTLGLFGFVLVYALRGAFTGLAHHHIWLFLLYGPASRLVMSILLFAGLLSYDRPPDRQDRRLNHRAWVPWIALFVIIDVAVAILASSPIAGSLAVRLTMEGGALLFSTLNVTAL